MCMNGAFALGMLISVFFSEPVIGFENPVLNRLLVLLTCIKT